MSKLTIKGIVQMQSPPGTPGAWSVIPEAGKFRLMWDGKPAPFELFDSHRAAIERMEKFYADNPSVPVTKREWTKEAERRSRDAK